MHSVQGSCTQCATGSDSGAGNPSEEGTPNSGYFASCNKELSSFPAAGNGATALGWVLSPGCTLQVLLGNRGPPELHSFLPWIRWLQSYKATAGSNEPGKDYGYDTSLPGSGQGDREQGLESRVSKTLLTVLWATKTFSRMDNWTHFSKVCIQVNNPGPL